MTWGAIGGAVAGSAASGIMGGLFGDDDEPEAPTSQFRPYSVTSGYGSASGSLNPMTGKLKITSSLNPQLSGLMSQGFSGASDFMKLYGQQAQQPISPFQYNYDTDKATQDYYQTGLGLLQPQMTQMAQQSGERMFGTGRLGLQLSGESLGAGAGTGMMSPDAYTTQMAQNRALAELYGQSREKALAEQMQDYNVSKGIYGTNIAAQQQYLQNLGSGLEGMFGIGTGLSDLERSLNTLGISGSGTASGAGMMTAQAQPESMMSKFMGGAIPGVANAVSGGVADWLGGGQDYGTIGGFGNPKTTKYGSMDFSM